MRAMGSRFSTCPTTVSIKLLRPKQALGAEGAIHREERYENVRLGRIALNILDRA